MIKPANSIVYQTKNNSFVEIKAMSMMLLLITRKQSFDEMLNEQ